MVCSAGSGDGCWRGGVWQGTCNGLASSCYIGGYAMESKCVLLCSALVFGFSETAELTFACLLSLLHCFFPFSPLRSPSTAPMDLHVHSNSWHYTISLSSPFVCVDWYVHGGETLRARGLHTHIPTRPCVQSHFDCISNSPLRLRYHHLSSLARDVFASSHVDFCCARRWTGLNGTSFNLNPYTLAGLLCAGISALFWTTVVR